MPSEVRLADAPHGIRPSGPVRRLEWFTAGFFGYQRCGDTLAIADLRIGYHPDFDLSFEIARRDSGAFAAVEPTQVGPETPRSATVGAIVAQAARDLGRRPT